MATNKQRKNNMANDLWRTPPEVFNSLNSEFCFVVDMAASHENSLCELYYSEIYDSLSFCWALEVLYRFKNTANPYAWCNPPYSNPMPWIKKALEAQSKGLGVVMLLNADNSVGWFAEALKGASEIRFIIADENNSDAKKQYSSGRLGFIDSEGNAVNSNNKPQMILVFDPFRIGTCFTRYIKKSELMGAK